MTSSQIYLKKIVESLKEKDSKCQKGDLKQFYIHSFSPIGNFLYDTFKSLVLKI
jgi:hypothetical protein